MSGFSEEVAMAVTQPLWPSIEPRKRRDSAILDERRVEFGAVTLNYLPRNKA
jgi:hypothetical protein